MLMQRISGSVLDDDHKDAARLPQTRSFHEIQCGAGRPSPRNQPAGQARVGQIRAHHAVASEDGQNWGHQT